MGCDEMSLTPLQNHFYISFRLTMIISRVTSQEFIIGFDLVRQICLHPFRLSSIQQILVAIQTKRYEAAYRLFPSFQ